MNNHLIFLGDSITDGGTLVLLIEQAAAAAGRTLPTILNAGVGGDSAAQALARISREVLPYVPATVVMMTGVNDAYRGIDPAQTLAAHRAAAGVLADAGCTLIIVTPTALRTDLAQAPALAALATRLATQAQDLGLTVVDGFGAIASCVNPWVADGIHLSPTGFRALAEALLPALDLGGIALPDPLIPMVIPGLITQWTITTPTATLPITLPQPPDPNDDAWVSQERARGFLIDWPGAPGRTYGIANGPLTATTTIPGGPCTLWLGGHIATLHLDGLAQHLDRGWFGWHLGHHRLVLDLAPGDHRLDLNATGGFAVARR